ncbi:hypothetical protein ACHAQJ_003412 [Trichoderma viride]
MESQERGLRERFRDWRRRKSRTRAPATQEIEAETTVAASAAASASVSTRQPDAVSTRTLNNAVSPNQTDSFQVPLGTTKSAQLDLPSSSHVVAAVPDISISAPPISPSPLSSLQDKSSALWKEAYDKLRSENVSLFDHYEAVLKEQAGVSPSSSLRDQLTTVASAQRKKAANKQWRFQWFGEQQSVRDTVERILSLTNQSASLIAIGMTYAPPYVSVPWSAVTALIPLMLNDIKEHKGCIAGLEIIAKLTFSYQMAERAFLDRDETMDLFKNSVIDLYKKILQYQALAIQYFGRSTLQRLGKNALGSTEWADMPAAISLLDNDTRRSLLFLGQQSQIASLISIQDFLNRQEHSMNILIQKAAAERDEIAQVVEWVTSISVERDHKDVRQKLGKDHFLSGRWYLEEIGPWRIWAEGSQCLWLKGGVGAGKSSLMSILIEDLMQSPDGVTAFFYCSRKADKGDEKSTLRSNHENTLRSLLAQVAVSVEGTKMHDNVVKRSNRDPRRVLAGLGLSAEDCVQLLDDVLTSDPSTHFTIVIDALDECTDYDGLLQSLCDTAQSNKNVRFAFSSRFQVKVDSYFPKAAIVTIATQNQHDIQRFLDIEIPKRRAGSGMTDDQASRLNKALMSKADGMFMWAKLQVNLFLNEIKSKRIRLEEDIEPKLLSLEASGDIGEGLLYVAYNDVYHTAVGGTSQDRRREIVTTALRWVLCSFRTLTLRELAYATSMRPDGTVAPGIQEGLVLEFCSNLLIEDSVGIVRLPHLSVRHYLEKRDPPDFDHELAHLQAALTCLYFANSPHYHEIGQSQSDMFQQGNVTLTKGFYTYVTSYWTRHCREARKTDEVDHLMATFAGNSKMRRTRTFSERAELGNISQESAKLSGQTAETNDSSATREASTKLLTSFEIFEDLIEHIDLSEDEAYEVVAQYIARGVDLGVQDQLGNTLLHEAARFRQLKILKALSDAGAPVNSQNRHGNTPMHLASIHHFNQGAQQLLLAGADKNVRNLKGETPLHLAVLFRAHTITETLISANADALAKDHQGNTPLHYAAAVGNETILESFLLTGYNPNGKNQDGESVLSLAIKLGNSTMVKLLLDHNVVVAEDDITLSAMSRSAEVVRLISQHGTTLSQPIIREPDTHHEKANNLYSVKFVGQDNKLSHCEYCNVARWIIASRRGASYKHWPSVRELSRSAADGCPLCGFFSKELKECGRPEVLHAPGELVVTIDPCSTQGSRMDRKDKLILYAGDSALLTYELCTDHVDDSLPVLDWLTGRTISEIPTTPTSLHMIQRWMSTILDVSDTKVRLVSSDHSQTGRYLYLSFKWGRYFKSFFNTRALFPLLKSGVLPDELAPTLRDAVFMTRLLGIRYLWIDALCIVQDDHEDVTKEVLRMATYIQNAFFVMVAATGTSPATGLFCARKQPLFRMDFVQYAQTDSAGGKNRVPIYLRLELETAAEALSQALGRAWMVQEVVLPRRLLIQGANQLYWHCRTCLMSEGSTVVQKPFLKLLPRAPEPLNNSNSVNLRTCLPWYDFLHIYSPAKTAYLPDRAAAVEAIARYFDGTLDYASGLWMDDLRNGLLWFVDNVVSVKRKNQSVAPTWSWISVDDQVRYNFMRGNQHERVPQDKAFFVLQFAYDNGGPGPSGDIRATYLEIEAMALETSVGSGQGECSYYFDQMVFEQHWRKSIPFLLVFVCPWNLTSSTDLKQARGIGLVLCNAAPERDESEYDFPGKIDYDCSFMRVGLFHMMKYDETFVGWSRRKLKLV